MKVLLPELKRKASKDSHTKLYPSPLPLFSQEETAWQSPAQVQGHTPGQDSRPVSLDLCVQVLPNVFLHSASSKWQNYPRVLVPGASSQVHGSVNGDLGFSTRLPFLQPPPQSLAPICPSVLVSSEPSAL